MPEIKNQYKKLLDAEKIDFLKEIEFGADETKWELFEQIISDENDFDLARIEVFRILEVSEIPVLVKDKMAFVLLTVIKKTEDYDVRNYASVAMANFIEFPEVKSLAISMVLNQEEDIDLRYSAFAAVKKISDVTERNSVLQQLLQDKDLQRSAQRVLNEGY